MSCNIREGGDVGFNDVCYIKTVCLVDHYLRVRMPTDAENRFGIYLPFSSKAVLPSDLRKVTMGAICCHGHL